MSIAETLYKLQQIDQTIAAKQKRLTEVEAQLGESEELREARDRLEQAEKQLQDLVRTQRQQDLELRSVADKIESEESRLYGGRVKNPKELAGLQKEVRYLKERRTELEDELLDTMLSREEVSERVEELQVALNAIKAEWESAQAGLVAERDQLKSDLAEAQRRREELLKKVPSDALSIYEYLRRTKGIAVAPVEDGMCMGCRVTLSAVDRQRVRGDDLMTCSNCGRVLVVL